MIAKYMIYGGIMSDLFSVTSIPIISSCILLFYYISNYIYEPGFIHEIKYLSGNNIKKINPTSITIYSNYLFGMLIGYFFKTDIMKTSGIIENLIILIGIIFIFLGTIIFFELLFYKQIAFLNLIISILLCFFGLLFIFDKSSIMAKELLLFIISLTFITAFNVINTDLNNIIMKSIGRLGLFFFVFGFFCMKLIKIISIENNLFSVHYLDNNYTAQIIVFLVMLLFITIPSYCRTFDRKNFKYSIILLNNGICIECMLAYETNEDLYVYVFYAKNLQENNSTPIVNNYLNNYGINERYYRFKKSDVLFITEYNENDPIQS